MIKPKDAMLYPNAKVSMSFKANDFMINNIEEFIIFREKNSGTILRSLDISKWKLQLRPIESLTEEEKSILREDYGINFSLGGINSIEKLIEYSPKWDLKEAFDKLREWNIDIDGFIASGKAVAE